MSLRVLLVDARGDGACNLQKMLQKSGLEIAGTVTESVDLIAVVTDMKPDAIIIDADSPSRDTLESMAALNQCFPRPIVMLSENGDATHTRAAAQAGVSAYVVDGLSPQLIRSLIEVSMLHFQSQNLLHAELARTRQAMDERRDIDRAKCMLMENHGLSENESYHRLRRMAMDRGQRLVDLARLLLTKATA